MFKQNNEMLSFALFFVVVCFLVLFSIVTTSLGEERVVYVLLVHLLAYFSLPLGVRCWLRLVIVALPGLSVNLFLPIDKPIIAHLVV